MCQQMNHNQENEGLSPSQLEMQKMMSENIHGKDVAGVRVLAFQKKAPAPPDVSSLLVTV